MKNNQANGAGLSALIRSTLFVRNRKRAKLFYRALGFSQLYFEGVLEHPSASAVLGLTDVISYPVSILKTPGPNVGMLGLFELPESDNAVPSRTGPAAVGESALVFYVRDFDSVLPRLKAAGATWLPATTTFELGHFKHREICLRDCDGFLVNLIERQPEDQFLTGPELDFTPLDNEV
ncbi:MAG: hypothetical protein HWE26_11520 [Alteromonadaceae bacterium]|nr:hypothetical protein [Alteromonadaceae bacterium]